VATQLPIWQLPHLAKPVPDTDFRGTIYRPLCKIGTRYSAELESG
jgi:hypothetical protein